ncbi:hypothetical protein TSUD_90980 [Trifolium subterraneum]|uniref:18S rRNA (guanine(1575)-N(7))-methyltransferase Bud23 C-terminal domain-containing protein n=1 Tax=Trifolium subterraneum TaxID=3900 RepID=A0A2Z6PIM5_TRISU|nr:hypothetical protein TSUD_90980 [Trifolium subterraneum]
MGSRPEVVAPSEIFYGDDTTHKYTSNFRSSKFRYCINWSVRLRATFYSVTWISGYVMLINNARAVFQLYPEILDQRQLISKAALAAGFKIAVYLVDYPRSHVNHQVVKGIGFTLTVEQLSYGSSKRKKEFLFLACCENVPLPEGKDDDDSEGEENKTVYISDRHRPRKKQKNNNSGKGREWIKRKKEQREEEEMLFL